MKTFIVREIKEIITEVEIQAETAIQASNKFKKEFHKCSPMHFSVESHMTIDMKGDDSSE